MKRVSDSDDCGVTIPALNHLTLSFLFFCYRSSASVLTNTLSLCHLTMLGASHFSYRLSTVSSSWQILYPSSMHLFIYHLCSPFTSPTTPYVIAFLGSLCLCLLLWADPRLTSAIDGLMASFSAEGFQFYILAWSLASLRFSDDCSIFPFMSPTIISKTTCPKLNLSSSFSHPHDSIYQVCLFFPRQYHFFFLLCQPPKLFSSSFISYV